MVEVKDRGELRRVLESNRLVLVVVYDSGSPTGRYLASIADDIAAVVEPVMVVAKVDLRLVPGALAELGLQRAGERLRLYLDGEAIWEQIGVFHGNPSADKYAIRRGILAALRSRNLSPAKLGLRLVF